MAILARSERNRAWHFSEEQIGLSTVYVGAPYFRTGEISIYWPNRKLHKLLTHDLDVVILGGWESPAYLYALWIAKKRGVKTVGHYGSTYKSHRFSSGLAASYRSWYFRQLDAIVSYGSEATRTLVSMQVDPDRIVTGFNSVDHEYFHKAVNTIRIEQKDQAQVGHNFLYVGQLLKRKNIDNVIRAFSSMRDDSDTLRIVGSGPEEQYLRDLILEIGLTNEIVMTGPKAGEALMGEYARSNTLILASTNEVWGLVVNEALSSGLHVVVSENCGAAADVKWMEGVYGCETSLDSIARSMKSSANEWQGPIAKPAILQVNINRLDNDFFVAIKQIF